MCSCRTWNFIFCVLSLLVSSFISHRFVFFCVWLVGSVFAMLLFFFSPSFHSLLVFLILQFSFSVHYYSFRPFSIWLCLSWDFCSDVGACDFRSSLAFCISNIPYLLLYLVLFHIESCSFICLGLIAQLFPHFACSSRCTHFSFFSSWFFFSFSFLFNYIALCLIPFTLDLYIYLKCTEFIRLKYTDLFAISTHHHIYYKYIYIVWSVRLAKTQRFCQLNAFASTMYGILAWEYVGKLT